MVNYPDLSSLTNSSGIGGLLALPSSSYPFFWAWILGGIWAIMVLTMYFKDKEKGGRGRLLSAMAVSSFAVIFLGVIGTILTIISVEVMINILVTGLIVIAIWWFNT